MSRLLIRFGMKNRYKVLLAGGIIEIGLLIGAGFVKYGILIWLVFNCLCVLSLLLLRFLNRTIKKTEWYKNLNVDPDHTIFPDNTWYREHDERNYDVVNLGSSSGKWAFNYSIEPIKGMNWAIQPQTLVDDFKILKNFHSILKNEGYVLITIMPFTGLNKKTGLMDTYKYLGTLDYTLIDPKFSNEAYKYRSFPFLFGKRALKEAARYLLGKDKKVCPL